MERDWFSPLSTPTTLSDSTKAIEFAGSVDPDLITLDWMMPGQTGFMIDHFPMSTSPAYSKSFMIPPSAIDENGHVNNVAYVQWMQDIAVEHYSSIGGVNAQGPDATWVVREHRIEYLLPAFAAEEIEIRTWVENIRRVRSLRKYEFLRKSDGRVLVRGETDWVFVNSKTGKPLPIPEEVVKVFANQK